MTKDQPAPFVKPVTAFTITEGNASAPTIMRRIPVRWVLDPATGYVRANGEYAGRVAESIPDKLYYFQSPRDADKGDYWGSFGTAHRAAEQGAIRHVLSC